MTVTKEGNVEGFKDAIEKDFLFSCGVVCKDEINVGCFDEIVDGSQGKGFDERKDGC